MEKTSRNIAPMRAKTNDKAQPGRRIVPQGAKLQRVKSSPVDIKHFEPITPGALGQVRFLTQRGAKLIKVTRDQVTLQRMEQLATVDAAGRVQWAPLSAA